MRAADADARGSMTNIAVTMNTANRICIAYCSDAIIAPTCIVPCVDPVAAEPDDRDAGEVQHQDQRRHQERDQAVHGDRGVGQIEIRLIEPLALMRAAIERADHADAAQPFAEHQVQAVDLDLHRLRQRNRAAHDHAEDHRHHRHDGDQHPGELRHPATAPG